MSALETGLVIACVFLFAVLWIVLVRANRIIARRNNVIVTLQGKLAEEKATSAHNRELWAAEIRAHTNARLTLAERGKVIKWLTGELAEAQAKAAPFLARNRGERGRFTKRAA